MPSDDVYIALDAVRSRLEEKPDGYEQATWGNNEEPSCETPGCIAGHIVATVKDAQKGYRRRIQGLKDGGTTSEHEDAIRDAATEALGLDKTPRLFEPTWPIKWFEKAGYSTKDVLLPRIEPRPEDAIAILSAILEGDLEEALEPSRTLDEEPDNRG